MTQNNNLSVLPFYTSLNEQNHRKSYAYGEIYPLYCPSGEILAFQFMTAHLATNNISSVLMKNLQGQTVYDLTSAIVSAGLRKTAFASDGYDIFMYPDIVTLGVNMLEGRYYLQVTVSAGTFYSEVFTVVGDISPFLKLEWKMTSDLIGYGWRIQYASGEYDFRNVVYLATELGKPDYEFEEQGETRDGFFFPEKMLSEKKYKFQFMAPEYLCDVLRFVRMADRIRVTDKYGRVYLCDSFLMTPKWQEQGDLASVEAEFLTNTVAKALGLAEPPYGLMGDYNNDFNNDYDITD